MAILPILTWPDDRLVQVCAPFPCVDDGVHKLAQDMLATLYATGGRGLAAPQVGDLRQMFVMDVTWKDGASTPMVFVNPRFRHPPQETQTGPEQCLSIPGITAQVRRATKVDLSWVGLDGEAYFREFTKFEAICVQHEMDHLAGIVTLLKVDPQQRETLEAEYYS